MSALLEIKKQIEITAQRVTELERLLSDHPDRPSVTANLDSMVRMQRKLEREFAEAAASLGVEICQYRAFDDQNRQNAGAAFGAISEFQRLFSVVFGSLKYGKKQRARIDSELEKEAAFGFGYAFSGSVGVVLTAYTDVDLFGQSYLDDAMRTTFAMAQATEPSTIQQYADRLGLGAINALYQWADDSAQHGLGADIEWRRGSEVKHRLFIQRQELSRLRKSIQTTSSEKEKTITVEGKLFDASLSTRRFLIKREGMRDIRGTFEPGTIDDSHVVTIPRTYSFTILRRTKLYYATGKEEVRYHLIALQPIDREAA